MWHLSSYIPCGNLPNLFPYVPKCWKTKCSLSCCQILCLNPNVSYNTVGYCLVEKIRSDRLIIKNIFDHQIDMNGQGVLCWMNHSCSHISKQKDIFLILMELPQKSLIVTEHIAEEIWNWAQRRRQMRHSRKLHCQVQSGECVWLAAEGGFGLQETSVDWPQMSHFRLSPTKLKARNLSLL